MYTATVREGAPDLLGSTLRDLGFRTKFKAAIISVKRKGQRVDGKFGDVVLQVCEMTEL